jgi:predicted regulator of Ras-like GTPase activity (Roadblock/LC7/MglB family)
MDGFRLKDEKYRGGIRDGLQEQRGPESQHEAGDFASILTEIISEEHTATISKHDSISKEEAMASAKEILSDFSKLQGVDAVCLVGRDGFLLDSIARTGIDTEMIGAIASSGFGASEAMGRQLGKGLMSISMIEFEKGPVMFSPVGDDAFLVIVAEKDSNLGMIRLKLKKHSTELATAAAI